MSYPAPDQERAEALKHSCPLCGAEPGQPCRTCIGGSERRSPHVSRRVADRSDQPEPDPRHALCCECGELRTIGVKFNIRYSDANRSQGTFDDERGWISTCTLRCSHCGTATRHALVAKPDEPDWVENSQRFILGGEPPSQYWGDDQRERLRVKYFEQFPRNPKLHHWYWSSEGEDAWAAGERTVTALCGATMPLTDPSRTSERAASTDLVEPDRIDWETELEDAETGLWWVDMDCVDCLAVVNSHRLSEQRKAVLTKLLEASAAIEAFGATDLAALSKHLDALIGGDQ